MTRCASAGWALLAATMSFGQGSVPVWQTAAGGKMAFEVASVKHDTGPFRPPNFPLDSGNAYAATGGRFSADFALPVYVSFAYKLPALTQEQRQAMFAHLPKWVATDRFDIQAKAEGNPTKDQMRLMLQDLLADRFKLEVHFETKEMPLLALTLAKPGKLGPKLRPHSEGPPCDSPAPDAFPDRCEISSLSSSPSRGFLAGSRDTTLESIAGELTILGRLGRPVVDQTGLAGSFDFTIEWRPESDTLPPARADAALDIQGPTFLEALREQLGLKLEPTRGPVRTLIIDHVDTPSEN